MEDYIESFLMLQYNKETNNIIGVMFDAMNYNYFDFCWEHME